MKPIFKTINFFFKIFCVEISKDRDSIFFSYLTTVLKETNTDLILDIGACKGFFSEKIIKFGYSKKIISFEPISFLNEALHIKSKNHSNWEIFPPVCVGNSNEKVSLNISSLIGNSSILQQKGNKFNINGSEYYKTEIVNQITLADLNDNGAIKKVSNVFVKLDVQGYESQILSVLEYVNYNIIGFYIELSLIPIYENQEDYLSICTLLKNRGYDLIFIEPESYRHNRMVQFNGVFLKKGISY